MNLAASDGTTIEVEVSIEGREVFQYDVPGFPTLWYDVTAAKAAIERGEFCTTAEIEREQMRHVMERNEWTEAELASVDPSEPGIAVPFMPVPDLIVYMLIDGTHRCVKAYRENRPFFARCLTDKAAAGCLMNYPHPLMSWPIRAQRGAE
jgi:hypothetical protein